MGYYKEIISEGALLPDLLRGNSGNVGSIGELLEIAADEIELLRKIGIALIESDERGQGLPWQEAIKELSIALGYNAIVMGQANYEQKE